MAAIELRHSDAVVPSTPKKRHHHDASPKTAAHVRLPRVRSSYGIVLSRSLGRSH